MFSTVMIDENGNQEEASVGLVITPQASVADFERALRRTTDVVANSWSGGIFTCKGFDAIMPEGGKVEGYSLKQLQKAVGGYIQTCPVPRSDYIIMIVNEEGRLIEGMELNPLASKIAGQAIVGTVVLIDFEDLK